MHAATRLRLATYSLQVLKDVSADTKFDYYHTDKGLLYVYRTQHSMDEGVRQMNVLKRNGLDVRVIGPKEVAALEPALAPVQDALVGAVYIPSDGTGDARIFTQELSRVCGERGVNFLYDKVVEGLKLDGSRATGVETSRGFVAADAVVDET